MIETREGAAPPVGATSADRHHVVIIGGGISGLSAAWYLQQQARARSQDISYTILESSDRWGGKILTERVEGFGEEPFRIEGGPDSFMTQKPWALQLARDLGLGDRLLGTNDQKRRVYVLHRGKPVGMPDGVLLIVPTKFMPFALSPLISPMGKLRMGMELLIPRKRDDEDETLAEFVRRRLGNEALDKIAEPMMSGIYNAEADRQSILATFPRFRQMEKEHGSLIRGMLASRRVQRTSNEKAANSPKLSMFMSLRDGTQELVDTLVQHLDGALRLQTRVDAIEAADECRYRVTTSDGDQILADAVLLTTPAYVTANLLQPLSGHATDRLAAIRYVSTGTISLAFRSADVNSSLDGFGLVVPKSEKRPINAITVSSTKFDQRAPEGYVLLRIFFGGSRSPETMQFDDEELLKVVRQELRAILGVEAAPLFHRIYRWHKANPQYDIGHLERVEEIERTLPHGIHVTGSAFRGVGMPDCVFQAQQSAARIVEALNQPEKVA